MKIRVAPLLLLGALLLWSCGDETNTPFEEAKLPAIAANKTSLSFSVVSLGESTNQVIEIRNEGEGLLKISGMKLSGTGASAFTVFTDIDIPYAGETIELPSVNEGLAARREFLIEYKPSEVGEARATLSILSNDPKHSGGFNINLVALEIGPQVQVIPNPIVFGPVAGNDSKDLDVRISNIGSAPLRFDRISISGSPDFKVDEPLNRDAIPFPAEPLATNESFGFKLWYRPPTNGPDTGFLNIVYYFGTEKRTYVADISGNGAEPCIRITPQDQIDFGQSIIGKARTQQVTVENCGNQNLTVNNLYLAPGSDPEFALDGLPNEIISGTPLVLAQGSSRSFQVSFSPLAEQPYRATLKIESDAPGRNVIEMPVYGIGSVNNCPVAVANARVLNSGEPFSDQVVAEPLDNLELSAVDSFDPDGNTLSEYRWSVAKAPPGFALGFEPSAKSKTPKIQLALVGDYVFELTVVDEHGSPSCEAARVNVRAKSDKSLIIELTWRTPSDLNETDTCMGCGTDLDLHFLRPGGMWADRVGGTDCHFNTPNPLWGDPANFDDDPHLDRDDTDGGGPVQVNVKTPARTDGTGGANGYNKPYQVGVYFYDSWNFDPPVLATVRVFLNGSDTPSYVVPTVEAGAEAAVGLTLADPYGNGHFWLVGSLDWSASGGTFTENVDLQTRVRTGFPLQ
ncbi:MAG: choice-of-anchor D domain-containing protein [Myxococcota bacterium]|jgi:hypothetical protein|nr:choice-of-anchor D domain-containing protein [Myxococcota bacterium]